MAPAVYGGIPRAHQIIQPLSHQSCRRFCGGTQWKCGRLSLLVRWRRRWRRRFSGGQLWLARSPGRHDCYSTSPRPRQKTICFTVVLQMCESSPLRAPLLCPDIADSSSNTLSVKEGAERRARLSLNTIGRSRLASCRRLNMSARSGCWIWRSYSLIRELRNIAVCSFLSYSQGNCTQTCQFFLFKRSF